MQAGDRTPSGWQPPWQVSIGLSARTPSCREFASWAGPTSTSRSGGLVARDCAGRKCMIADGILHRPIRSEIQQISSSEPRAPFWRKVHGKRRQTAQAGNRPKPREGGREDLGKSLAAARRVSWITAPPGCAGPLRPAHVSDLSRKRQAARGASTLCRAPGRRCPSPASPPSPQASKTPSPSGP